jgi:eukaryotic-like serine/threonine-protein kinase
VLTSGTRLGPYEIQSLVGSGGMGEVYKARDTRLDRTVAVKVLTRPAAGDPEFHDRIEREARAISQLNHPHICTLYDVGEAPHADAPLRYLVMEFVEGQTLAARLARGPLPLPEALACARQIADALDKAHRTGIVHGDLKPGNIMLTPAGAKLLDFGLARQQPVASAAGSSELPTRTMPVSRAGTVLGTLQYLAPEQLEGHPPDGRSDIFAFGAVLYEMVTGRKAFDGPSPASIIAAIIRDDPPPVTTVRPGLPPALDHTVRTCLAKAPDDRWQHAGDLARSLQWVAEAGPIGSGLASRAGARAWMAVAAALLAVGTVVMVWAARPAPAPPLLRTSVLLPEGLRFPVAPTVGGVGRLALSPDGRRLAFVATDPNGTQMLWVRPLDALSASAVPGTEGATSPFWSHDSRHLAFIAQGQLKRVEASGAAPPVTLAFAFSTTCAWGPDDTILFTPTASSPLFAMSASGGPARPVTVLDEAQSDMLHRSPVFLPDGTHFLYVAVSARAGETTAARGVYAGSLAEARAGEPVLDVGANVRYADGHLIYLRGNVLVAQPFDTRRRRLTGPSTPITEPVELVGSRSAAFTVSDTGLLAYQPASDEGTQLVWMGRDGLTLAPVGEPGNYGDLELSPDGQRAAVSLLDPVSNTRDIWILDLERGVRTRLTVSRSADQVSPIWSPDGTQIVFASSRAGHFDLYVRSASGLGGDELLYADDAEKYPTSWAPDGSSILYTAFDATGRHLWLLPLGEDRTPVRLAPFAGEGRFSPDGKWILYDSAESGRIESYAVTYPEASEKIQVSSAGGSGARWSPNGAEIVYAGRDNYLMAVAIEPNGRSLRVGTSRQVLQARPAGPRAFFDLSGDGERILLNTLRGDGPSAVTLVQHWRAVLSP